MEEADSANEYEQTFEQNLGVPLMDNEEGEGTYDNVDEDQINAQEMQEVNKEIIQTATIISLDNKKSKANLN